MPDFENIIEDFGSDAKNIVSGDFEIAGKKIPKIAVIGGGVGVVALFLFIAKKGQSGVNSNTSDLPLGLGNASPDTQNSDNFGLGSALDNLGTQLGGIPSDTIPSDSAVGISDGNLSDFLGQLPVFGSDTNPAFTQLPDLSGFNLATPTPYENDAPYVNQPYSILGNESAQVAQLYANETAMLGGVKRGGSTAEKLSSAARNLIAGAKSSKANPPKTVNKVSGNALSSTKSSSSLVSSLLSGFKSVQNKVTTTPVKSVSANAVSTKSVQNFSTIFGGTKPTATPVKASGKAVVSKPVTSTSFFSNIFSSYAKPIVIQPLPKPTINYGSIGYNWSNPLPLPKASTSTYGSIGYNWSKPAPLPKPTTAPKSSGFSSSLQW